MSERKPKEDARFAGVFTDPKFRRSKKDSLKVKLDNRFSKKDLQVNYKSKVDRYGRKIIDRNEKDKKDFDKYYTKDEDEENKDEEQDKSDQEEESEEEDVDEKADDDEDVLAELARLDRARGDVPSDYVSSSDDYSSSESESSGESEVDSDEESDAEIESAKPETGDPSKTVAVVNLDWDHVKSTDLMITFSGFIPKGGKINKIAIYPSEFGKERMQREEIEGPPKELFKKKNKKGKKSTAEDNEDDVSDVDINDLYEEGDADKNIDSKSLRQYQLERLRYYYAVVYCNNIGTAESIYKNCDGTEYESTANVFDIRYVPDEMTFDDTPRDECDQLPKNYKPLQFSTDALQHSNVKLTWDETPADRVEISKRAFSQKEIDEMDFKAYLASDSDESESELNNDSKNKLKSLVGGGAFGNVFGKDTEYDLDGSDDEDGVDMEITFTPGLDEKKEASDNETKKEESTIEKLQRKEKERRKLRKQKVKDLKEKSVQERKEKLNSNRNRNKKNNNELLKDEKEKQDKSKAELELLMMDEDDRISGVNNKAHFNMNEILRSEKEKGKKSKYQDKNKIVQDEFKPNLNDSRFDEIFEDHAFAIDPTQPEFKQTSAMKEILNERTKRASKKQNKDKDNKKRKNTNEDKSDISNIVNKLKKKIKNKRNNF
ncbi:hypothetical protein TBLA_0A06540 [Henningerozyma blattae CBS 6284]|uniref:Uncharacterized protein n=1 Tax=Henningerozyma blattae (strain ATCC 34711 / CBS 6284 / DSM 70876 / NBRC 10599 / NRRL Y-10934 / UCD 77-7) TaxID=1071380 RepID=I2GWE4_HENB6|nr:hypothetical protein TBLA_0A06540 [Tetrapisispora blattae CBS 6284]CCH58446.1 hypothetical protein TBLA_0A06540 [Tetrapisispora blattae CBS 6284]